VNGFLNEGDVGFHQTVKEVAYSKVQHVIADGDFVFALSEGKRGSENFWFYDLFRVRERQTGRALGLAVPASTASGLAIF
jgi:hypothetical protein